jgi:hypothetical protein
MYEQFQFINFCGFREENKDFVQFTQIHYLILLQRINDAIMEEYLDRVFDAIKSNTELENLQEGIGNGIIKSVS